MRFVYVVLILPMFLGCKSSSPSDKDANSGKSDGPAIAEAMQQVGTELSTVLPLSLDSAQFAQPANQEMLDQYLSDLANFRHDRRSLKKRAGDDPALQFIGGRFGEGMAEARNQLNLGNRTYSRFLIRTAAAACVSCHSQGGRGPAFLASPMTAQFKALNEVDRANYLFAVGSDAKAMKLYLHAVENPNSVPHDNLAAVSLKALASAVRVSRDPELAQKITGYLTQAKWAPDSLRQGAKVWRTAINNWAASSKKTLTIADAKILLNSALRKQVQSPISRPGFIETLRASAELQDLIELPLRTKTYPEALYLRGQASNALHDIEPFSLNNAYYEACVNYAPHSKSATNCYLKLESSVLANYQDMDARPLPDRLRSNLQSLRRTAEPSESPILEWGQQHD